MERAEISARAKTDFVSRALTVLVLANKSAEIPSLSMRAISQRPRVRL